jgi:CBS domain-containing protein
MRSTRNLLLLRSNVRPPALRSAWRAGPAKPSELNPSSTLYKGFPSSAALTTTRLVTDPDPLENQPQRRDYAVELARTTLDLGKQVPPSALTPLSRLVNSITVEQMLAHKKDPTVYEVREDEPVINAIELMCDKNIGSVIVRGRETQLHVGIMSRIDCMRNLVLKNQFARETPIYKVMDKTISCVTPVFSLGQCLEIMAQAPDVRYLPVVSDIGDWTDDDTRVTGILGQRELLNWFVRSFLDAGDADIMDDADKTSARDLFDKEEKGECTAIYVSSDATVFDALRCMANNNATYVLVTKGQEIAGIFTGTDYLKKIILPGKKSKHTNIMDVVSKDLIVAAPHYTLIDCISLMLQNEIQHLPIGEWRQISPSESEDQREGNSVTAFGTDRYATAQPLGVITAFDCIDYLDDQPKMKEL